jgi:transposase-like protein
MRNNKENCPHCNADLQGEPIPKEQQESYGATHFSRKIGLYDLGKDRTVKYKCPDCNGEWDK